MSKIQVEMDAEEFAKMQTIMEEHRRKEAAKRAKEDRDALRSLSSEAVDKLYPKLEDHSSGLKGIKLEVYDTFRSIIETKKEVMGVETEGQRSHSFLSSDGRRRIIIGYYVRDGWDDTVEDGISKVKAYITSLAGDEESRKLVKIILDLLSRDNKGNLKAEKVLQLEKYAETLKDPGFADGVAIIKESYRPVRTKDFVRAQSKNAMGGWDDLPLGITEA